MGFTRLTPHSRTTVTTTTTTTTVATTIIAAAAVIYYYYYYGCCQYRATTRPTDRHRTGRALKRFAKTRPL